MKKLLVLFLCLGLIGCGSSSSYDKGYDDGIDERKNSFSYSLDNSYRRGYDDGVEAAYYYNAGCNDASYGRSPQYSSIDEYMDGYSDYR